MRKLQVIQANPRGFCAGVERAITIVEKALKKYGAPVYVHHEIVHNKHVVANLQAKGAVFVSNLHEVPPHATTIFSAHGVSQSVEDLAKELHLPTIDATCPLVKKVHKEAVQHVEHYGRQLILIGHAGHPEVIGTSGRVRQAVLLVETVADVEKLQVQNPENLAYVTQTTLSVHDTQEIIRALKMRFPNIHGPDLRDICYATQNRQDAVTALTKQVDMLLVIGSENSSNSNRLRDLGLQAGISSYLVEDMYSINLAWFDGISKVGLTAGASAPEVLLQELLDYLGQFFTIEVIEQNAKLENVHFKLPAELQEVA